MAALPEPSEEMAHLPRMIRTLVQRRRAVKDLIKRESDPVRRHAGQRAMLRSGAGRRGNSWAQRTREYEGNPSRLRPALPVP